MKTLPLLCCSCLRRLPPPVAVAVFTVCLCCCPRHKSLVAVVSFVGVVSASYSLLYCHLHCVTAVQPLTALPAVVVAWLCC